MLGKVTKEYLYKRKLVMPDLGTVKLLNKLRKLDFKDDTIMLALVDELEKLSGVPVPNAIQEIRTAPVLHKTECDKEDMEKTVLSFLERKI